jgi:GTPase SAR1 family protein
MKNMGNIKKEVVPDKPLPRDIRLGIWGSSGAGKTTYLAMLYHALEQSDNWRVQPGNDEADDFINTQYEYIFSEHKYPHPTEVDQGEKLKIYSYTLIRENSQYNGSITLKFVDAPGEFYERRHKENEKFLVNDPDNPEQDIIDYLMSCDGIIFLLDPDHNKNINQNEKRKAPYSKMLPDLFKDFLKRYRNKNQNSLERLEHYVAFCITKCDRDDIHKQISPNGHDKYCKGADEYMEELIGPIVKLRNIRNYIWLELDKNQRLQRSQHNRCQFFYTSAIGRYQKNGKSYSPHIEEVTPTQPQSNNINPELQYSSGWNGGERTYGSSEESSYPKSSNYNNNNDDNWDDINPDNKNMQNDKQKTDSNTRIEDGIELRPTNVLEPIEWLIEGIRLHHPIHY